MADSVIAALIAKNEVGLTGGDEIEIQMPTRLKSHVRNYIVLSLDGKHIRSVITCGLS